LSCAGGGSELERPEATLAKSAAAQRAFHSIHARWLLSTRGERLGLQHEISDYLVRYAADDSARVARVYLAWIRIEQGRLAEARAAIEAVTHGPTGSAHDSALITQAAILTREGRADAALELLRPLRGRIVDARERLLYGEEIVRAALAGRHHAEAVAYLLDWLAFAPAEDRYAVQTLIEARLERVPPTPLERSLRELDAAAAAGTETSSLAPARDWLRKAVRSRLTRLALESRDGALARRLLDSAAPADRRGDQGALLERIAKSSTVVPRVAGRAVGLLLTLRDSTTRRRSAHAVAGLSRALGLPRSNSDPNAVRLITGDDGESGGLEHGLAALAGEGAAVLIAGVDQASAEEAQRYAEAASIPVILLHAPKAPPRSGGFSFVLGTAVGDEDGILSAALSEQGLKAGVRVGPGGLSCDDRPPTAGEPRFGSARAKAEDPGSLLLLGDAACARDAIAELGSRKARPVLAFGLECAELFLQLDAPQRQLAASTGSFPWRAKTAPDSMRRWKATSGAAPSWYEVLGRDAGQLATAVLASFPLDRVDDARAVTNLHDRAQDELAKVAVELWSSERRGFAGSRRLERSIVVVASADPDPPKHAAPQARR
jgi:hypothetical protein